MEKRIKKERIIPRCREVLVKSGFSDRIIGAYVFDVRRLMDFMDETNNKYYTPSLGDDYLKVVAQTSWSDRIKQRSLKLVRRLNTILETESETINRLGGKSRIYEFPGVMGEVSMALLKSLQKQLKDSTIAQYRRFLSEFCVSMNEAGVSFDSLSSDNIITHIDSTKTSHRRRLIVIKALMQYAYENNLVSYSLIGSLEGIHYIEHTKLLSYYDPQEIKRLESTIDRSSATGKRDYAMTLLASRLGLRASDICNLSFSNIDWDNNVIHIQQEKTGVNMDLPLLEDVGSAIIDYVQSGRPKTKAKAIFVSHSYPDLAVTPMLLSSRIHKWFSYSSVDISERHFGPHALRHSLATTLMNNGIALPVISETLGHEFTSSTMIYLDVDINSLLACSLDVPAVEGKYYNQMGGILYE